MKSDSIRPISGSTRHADPSATRPAAGEHVKADQADEKVHQPVDRVSVSRSSKSRKAPEATSTGNRTTPLIDGKAAREAINKMIPEAKSNIQVEIYDFTDMELAKLLAAEAKEGVKVQVIVDPNPGVNDEHTKAKQEVQKFLKTNGVKVAQYPIDSGKQQIDHLKLLIVDGKSVIMGGFNWSPFSWKHHDADVRIDGPAANYFEQVFADDWKMAGGKSFAAPPPAKPVAGGNSTVTGAYTDLEHQSIKPMLLENIKGAKKSIHTELFVLSDKEVVQGLIDAHKRGVDVKVMLDPSGVYAGWSPNDDTFKELKDAGVPVKWYTVDQGQKLHAKWGTFDGKEMIIGSANWTGKGLEVNHEIAVGIADKSTTSAFEKQFAYDWENKGSDELPSSKPAKT